MISLSTYTSTPFGLFTSVAHKGIFRLFTSIVFRVGCLHDFGFGRGWRGPFPNTTVLQNEPELHCARTKLLKVGFILLVKKATWLSPIVVVPKKNGKIRVCVNYRKLNAVTITNTFPLPFTDGVLDVVVSHEVYNFLNMFRGYNQIHMHLED